MTKIYSKKAKALLQFFMLLPFFTFAQINLLQTTSNNITTAIQACGNANVTELNDYARLYNLTSLGYSSFEVTKVSFAVHGFQLGTATNFPVSVKVYASTGGSVSANLTLKGEGTVNITSSMVGTIVEVPLASPATVSSPEMFVVVSTPDGRATSTGCYLGGNSNGQTAPAYIKASGCGVNNFTSFSDLGVANMNVVLFPSGNATLPVTLTSFTAKANNNYTLLQWKTASEQNNKGFEIWRMGEEAEGFVKIGEVSASQTSNLKSQIYNYTDKQPLNGNNYYKLVQVDNDGKATELGENP